MIHEAGPLSNDGVQLCTRCGVILTDYRNTMVPDDQPPLRGWAVGAFIEVDRVGGMTGYTVTDSGPTCEET